MNLLKILRQAIIITLCCQLGLLNNANAETNEIPSVSGLIKCGDSAQFNKRFKTSSKKIKQRLKKYDPGSASALSLEQQLKRTETRFERYKRSNLLCGTDGLPHLIADGRWTHAPEFIYPGLGFLYITGWIGWVGRKYLQLISVRKNPSEAEIIIDVPLALQTMSTGYAWPLLAWQELLDNKLVASDDMVSVSPR